MIVVLCDSYEDAEEAFYIFLDILDLMFRSCVRGRFEKCLCVETDDNLRYIFCDYRMRGIFESFTKDLLEKEEFFEGLEGQYGFA